MLTRPKGYVKTQEPATKLAIKYYHKHPEFAEAIATRAERYNKCIAELMELKAEGKVFVFTPKTTFGVGRTEGDPVKLRRLYDYGYNHAKWAMDDLKNIFASRNEVIKCHTSCRFCCRRISGRLYAYFKQTAKGEQIRTEGIKAP